MARRYRRVSATQGVTDLPRTCSVSSSCSLRPSSSAVEQASDYPRPAGLSSGTAAGLMWKAFTERAPPLLSGFRSTANRRSLQRQAKPPTRLLDKVWRLTSHLCIGECAIDARQGSGLEPGSCGRRTSDDCGHEAARLRCPSLPKTTFGPAISDLRDASASFPIYRASITCTTWQGAIRASNEHPGTAAKRVASCRLSLQYMPRSP